MGLGENGAAKTARRKRRGENGAAKTARTKRRGENDAGKTAPIKTAREKRRRDDGAGNTVPWSGAALERWKFREPPLSAIQKPRTSGSAPHSDSLFCVSQPSRRGSFVDLAAAQLPSSTFECTSQRMNVVSYARDLVQA